MKHTRKVNWIPLPDPIQENEVDIELTWSSNCRTLPGDKAPG